MLAKSSKDLPQPGSRQPQEAESGHPVIRTLYDHFEVIINIGDINLVKSVCCCVIIQFHTAIQYIRLQKNNKTRFLKTSIEMNERPVSTAFY